MKTTVILHGGNSGKKCDDNDKFFYEIISSTDSDVVRVLCIYFARPEHRWEDSYAEDQSIFLNLAIDTGREIETKMASYNMDELRDNIKHADVIFINGGLRGHLKETLEQPGNFPELIAGKVLVGISAGANILSKYYYSTVADEIREGIGLLPIKLITHYDKGMDEQINRLTNYGKELPILKIPEEKYIVIDLP
jgi:peptidase E